MDALVDPEALLQLALAIAYGGAIGLERERRGRAAGLRTLILVCLGSTLIMIVSSRMPQAGDALDPAITRVDPSRIAAGIVTGVGFLGAAVVIRLGDLIRGVTTAAAIWFTAGLGIAIGSGAYGLATAATVSALVVLWFFNRMERLIQAPVYRVVQLSCRGADPSAIEPTARGILEELGLRVMDLRSAIDLEHDTAQLRFHVRARQDFRSPLAVTRLGALEGVRSVEWE